MTTPDIAGLCEKLRKVRSQGIRAGKLWNEDGPKAADTLERQDAEIERLRGALGHLHRDCLANDFNELWDSYTEARTALTGEA
jgi:hypothetical protein